MTYCPLIDMAASLQQVALRDLRSLSREQTAVVDNLTLDQDWDLFELFGLAQDEPGHSGHGEGHHSMFRCVDKPLGYQVRPTRAKPCWCAVQAHGDFARRAAVVNTMPTSSAVPGE